MNINMNGDRVAARKGIIVNHQESAIIPFLFSIKDINNIDSSNYQLNLKDSVMNYQEKYNHLIKKAKSENRKKGNGIYYESHHIIPYCMGGTETVLLTTEEHFIAHYYLCFIYKNTKYYSKMLHAFNAMDVWNNGKRNYNEDELLKYAKEYKILREEYIKSITGSGNPFFGKKHTTPRNVLRGKEHPMYGKSLFDIWVKKYGKHEALNRLNKYSIKMSKSTFGEKNGFFGKNHTEKAKKKMSNANKGKKHTKKFCKNASKRMLGKNNPMHGKSVMDVWTEKYGIEEAKIRMKNMILKCKKTKIKNKDI